MRSVSWEVGIKPNKKHPHPGPLPDGEGEKRVCPSSHREGVPDKRSAFRRKPMSADLITQRTRGRRGRKGFLIKKFGVLCAFAISALLAMSVRGAGCAALIRPFSVSGGHGPPYGVVILVGRAAGMARPMGEEHPLSRIAGEGWGGGPLPLETSHCPSVVSPCVCAAPTGPCG